MSIELILLGDLLIVVESEDDEAVCPAVDAGAIGEAQFADWVRLRVATA